MEEEGETEEQQRFSYQQRLKAAVHYTVGCLCEEVALDKEMQFSKQTIAAISELTFRQCENFAKDLEMFARHAKRTTINTEDVKLLARRSNSLGCQEGRAAAGCERSSRQPTRCRCPPASCCCCSLGPRPPPPCPWRAAPLAQTASICRKRQE
ncbi:centromere protein S isoform X4 [Chlorocebus sabaeus]|uniref:centromere protein S isoform X4 n=1 Tax=Chlorocebus sabaeus TaxID=60711 RepID=UPI0018B0251F|nr:centromere protein S isoform X5 [Chlorocebus sabaeus]